MSLPRAIVAAIRTLKEGWVLKNVSRMQALLNGHGEPGTRAAPTQAGNNDQKYGVRIDHGEIFTKEDGKAYKRYKVQVNKNADSSTLRKLAQQDSHKVWAEAEIEMGMEAKDGGTGEDQGEGDTKKEKLEEGVHQLFAKFEEEPEDEGERKGNIS